MILITELCKKVEDILNGKDIAEPRPLDNLFRVAATGFFLDHIKDKKEQKNFVPVYVTSLGGEYNPVPNLKQTTQTFAITIYFPVRLKEQFFNFNEYLCSQFVGKIIDYGSVSGKALTNISPAEYGEIQQFDLQRFINDVKSAYKVEEFVEEAYMSMSFRIYLSCVGASFVLANCVDFGMSFKVTEIRSSMKANMQTMVDSGYPSTTLYRDITNDLTGISIDGEVGTFDLYAWSGIVSPSPVMIVETVYTKSKEPQDTDTLYYYNRNQHLYKASSSTIVELDLGAPIKYVREPKLDEDTKKAYIKYEVGTLPTVLYGTDVMTVGTYLYKKEEDNFVQTHIFVISFTLEDEIQIPYEKEKLVWSSSGTGVNVSPIAQQLINGDPYAKNIGNIVNYNKSVLAYVENDEFWDKLLTLYNENRINEISDLKLTKKYTFMDDTTKTYEYNQLTLSMNENISLGSPISFTITLGDR